MDDAEDELSMFAPDEEESGDITTIELAGGRSAPVSARLRPMLMEWDWKTDEVTGVVMREDEGGRTVPLFEEHVRLGIRFKGLVEHPIVPRSLIRTQFAEQASYKSLLAMAVRSRTQILWDMGFLMPSASEILQMTLRAALGSYHGWYHANVRYEFHPDSTQVLPGRFVAVPDGAIPYATLREWMATEYTGGWECAVRSATGIKPVLYAKHMERTVLVGWRDLLKDLNDDEDLPLRDIEAALKASGLSVWMLGKYALRTIRGYRPM